MIFPFSFWTWKIKVAWLALWIRIKCVWSRRMWEKKGEDAISAASSWLNQWQGNSFLFYYSFYWVTSLSIIIFRTHLFQHGLTFSILYWLFSLHFLLDQVFFVSVEGWWVADNQQNGHERSPKEVRGGKDRFPKRPYFVLSLTFNRHKLEISLNSLLFFTPSAEFPFGARRDRKNVATGVTFGLDSVYLIAPTVVDILNAKLHQHLQLECGQGKTCSS